MKSKSLLNTSNNTKLLTRNDWDLNVKNNLNLLINTYKNKNEYVIFDFDNTISIFDVEEQLAIYQLETMSFAFSPNELKIILASGLTNLDEDLSSYGYFSHGSYQDLIADIYDAYVTLYDKYGSFTYKGLNDVNVKSIHKEDAWKEFATKMRMMYSLICNKEETTIAYPWILYWFYGMTSNEVYDLAYRSHIYYSNIPTCDVVWTSPSNFKSRIGTTSVKFRNGISVTKNIKELCRAFANNGIDVWVCSASSIDVIKAGIDAFGLHQYCKGVLAMTIKAHKDGKYSNSYDYENGYGYLSLTNNKWERLKNPTKSQTDKEGKVTAINNSIVPIYQKGPLAGFMDSTGDFNFSTEYSSLRLVLCFNTLRDINDGGGLISVIATLQKDLKPSLKTFNKQGETLYLLQGRDENKRLLINSNKTIEFGNTNEKLFSASCEKFYKNLENSFFTFSNLINEYSNKTSKK